MDTKRTATNSNNNEDPEHTKQQLHISQQELNNTTKLLETTKHSLASSQQDLKSLTLTLQSTTQNLLATQQQLTEAKRPSQQTNQTIKPLEQQRLLVQLDAVKKELELVQEAYTSLERDSQLAKEEYQEQLNKAFSHLLFTFVVLISHAR